MSEMGEVKVATVEIDNMATLPVGSRATAGGGAAGHLSQPPPLAPASLLPSASSDLLTPERNNLTNKEMELQKKKRPLKQEHHKEQQTETKRTSLFIIMSFIYAKLLVVICIAYVVSEVVTHSLPLSYYEGFFTYLYGVSILFLLYVFLFLLQESSCCQGQESSRPVSASGLPPGGKKPTKKEEKKKEKENAKNQKKEKKEKEKEKKEKEKAEKEKSDSKKKEGGGGKEKETAPASTGAPAPPPPPPAGTGGAPPVPPSGQRNSRSNIFQNDVYPRKMRDVVREKSTSEGSVDLSGMGGGTLKKSKTGGGSESMEKLSSGQTESAAGAGDPELGLCLSSVTSPAVGRKRKTSQNTCSHGSFFLRVGAIAFGLATMIYNGLEFGAFFEIPPSSSCYQILRGVNPVLQMVFTFMQMYFIFMNSRLNIHRFKVIARFGLMHIVATNLCVWIRTLVLESLKEISGFLERNSTTGGGLSHQSQPPYLAGGSRGGFSRPLESFGRGGGGGFVASTATSGLTTASMTTPPRQFWRGAVQTMASTLGSTLRPAVAAVFPSSPRSTTTTTFRTTTTTPTTTAFPSTTTTLLPTTLLTPGFRNTFAPPLTTPSSTPFPFLLYQNLRKNFTEAVLPTVGGGGPVLWDQMGDSPLAPAALVDHRSLSSENCERTHIMGTIVQDSAPYLFPFIIEYSLIGAAVIYVMWRHIGRYPRYTGEEELEQRLEVILSRRAVVLAQAQHGGRMDCVGASKGLFLGLLLLVGSLICLILFFVLIHNPQLSLLAIYLADVSHCVLMALSVLAIIIGFIRVQGLKFKGDEQSDLNDILLRVSAFGLFVYAVFSIIAGSLTALTSEPNMLVMITGLLSILQVVLQLLFIADVSRRRVHLPEHDRSKPGRQIVTFLLIANVTMWIIYTFETQKVVANPVQLDFYGFLAWSMVQRITLPLCIFHRFHSAVTLAEIWKTSYKPRLD